MIVLGMVLVPALYAEAAGNRLVVSDEGVKDMQSGLVWSLDANPAGDPLSWDDAEEFIKILNTRNYAGHHDWRLPDIDELRKFVAAAEQAGGFDAAVGDTVVSVLTKFGCKNVQDDYWSSTTNFYNQSEAWFMNMREGTQSVGNTSLYYSVWPVRQEY